MNILFFSRFITSFFSKILFFLGVLFFCLIGSSAVALADDTRLPNAWERNVEQIDGIQVTNHGETSTEIINSLVRTSIIPIAKYIFIGIALLFLGMYTYYMAIGMGEEEQLTGQRKNFLFAIVGFTVLGISSKVVEIIDPIRENNSELIDTEKAQDVVQQIIFYLEVGLGIVAVMIVAYGAMRMITADGDDERASSGKNILKYGFIGIIAVMLADPLVNTVFYPNSGTTGVGDAEAGNFIQQGAGLLLFVLQFFAIALFISFVVAGFLYMTAGAEDEQSEKAKNTLIWTAIGALIVIASFTILKLFVPSIT
jgi:hypothetical protein